MTSSLCAGISSSLEAAGVLHNINNAILYTRKCYASTAIQQPLVIALTFCYQFGLQVERTKFNVFAAAVFFCFVASSCQWRVGFIHAVFSNINATKDKKLKLPSHGF